MKIGITQKQAKLDDRLYDCLDPQWYNLLSSHLLIPIPNITNIELDPSIECMILAGDKKIHDEKSIELMCFNHAVKYDIPLLAVGYSALYLNYLHNGINIPLAGHKKDHTVLMGGVVWNVNSDHDMGIYELGSKLTQIAMSGDKTIEGFKHIKRPFWGLLWHPEQLDHVVLPPGFIKILNGEPYEKFQQPSKIDK